MKRGVDQVFANAASEKRAPGLAAVQQVVDDIGVDLDSHVAGGSALEGRIAQVADGHGGGAHQDDLVFERGWAERCRQSRPPWNIAGRSGRGRCS